MKTINIGDPQPVDCLKCKDKLGYRNTKVEQLYSDQAYDYLGSYITIIDSEYRKHIRTLEKVVCHKCLTKLPFKINPTH